MTDRKPVIIAIAVIVVIIIVIAGLILLRHLLTWPYAYVHN